MVPTQQQMLPQAPPVFVPQLGQALQPVQQQPPLLPAGGPHVQQQHPPTGLLGGQQQQPAALQAELDDFDS
jgi:hypothetical protein